jgi:hypothetical protein
MNVMCCIGKSDGVTWNFFSLFDITPKFLCANGFGVAAIKQDQIFG